MDVVEHEEPSPGVSVLGMVAVGLATSAFAAFLLAGPPVVAAYRLTHDERSALSVLWATVGIGWLLVVLNALVRDRETRGWLLFGLVAWAVAIPPVLATLRRSLRRRRAS